jgi:hypothetical protein
MGNLPASLLAIVSERNRELCWTLNRRIRSIIIEQYFVGEVLHACLCCGFQLGVCREQPEPIRLSPSFDHIRICGHLPVGISTHSVGTTLFDIPSFVFCIAQGETSLSVRNIEV